MNCHYVSRFLTKPWELPDRNLINFDFTTNKITKGNSEFLFSREDLNTIEQEIFLNKYIETPLTNISNLFDDLKPIKKWKVQRAVFLLLLFQAPRYLATLGMDPQSYQTLFTATEPVLDSIVKEVMQKVKIKVFFAPATERFFFPEMGLFLVPALTSSRTLLKFNLCIPINTRTLLIFCPAEIEDSMAARMFETPGLAMAYSVGINDFCNKLAIPPELSESMPEPELIQAIRKARDLVEKYLRKSTSLINSITDFYARNGFPSENMLF